DELLRYLPGIEVQMRGPMGAQSDIVLRGGTFQQVLVIVDGLRLNDPNTGHFTSYIPITPSEIDRIEILKGASSAIYGSEAVGGVINIITKSFINPNGISKSEASAQLTAGEYGLWSLNAGGFTTNGTTSISAGVLSNNTEGQQQRGTKGFIHTNTASVSIGHTFTPHLNLAVRSSYDDRNFAAQNFYTTFLSDTAREKVKTWWNQAQLRYVGSKDIIRFSLGYKKVSDNYLYNSALSANNNKSDLLQALVTDEWKIKANSTLTTGGEFINKKIVSNDRGNHNVNQAAAFAVLNQQIGESFFVNPALRLDWNQVSGWELIPQINLSYHTRFIQLRGSAGKTTRDADFTERYNNYNKSFVSSGSIGNPALHAERSFSYEAGADVFPTKQLKFSATFFHRQYTDLIDFAITPYVDMPRKSNLSPTGTYALAKNISKVTTSGIEGDVQYSKRFAGTQQLWATLGFTWLESRSSDAFPSFYISSHAHYLSNFNLQYSNNRFLLSFNGLYKNRQSRVSTAPIVKVNPDYFILNGKAEAFLLQKTLSAFVESDNIFNSHYADLLGSQMPGRWFMAGIKITLSK
ncbi:MAG: TonB-dependent receptor plug domain-containing protein, partial [Candidatus Dadabacteria bacterium]